MLHGQLHSWARGGGSIRLGMAANASSHSMSLESLPPVDATVHVLYMMVALCAPTLQCIACCTHLIGGHIGGDQLTSVRICLPCARHVVGFLVIKCEMMPPSTIEGLGAYVATIGLPSLLFDSIAKLSLSDVDWPLVGAVLAAKLILAVLGAAFAWLTTRRADGTGFAYTLGGVITLLSTMSDDMGIGLPVFSAFLTESARHITRGHPASSVHACAP